MCVCVKMVRLIYVCVCVKNGMAYIYICVC